MVRPLPWPVAGVGAEPVSVQDAADVLAGAEHYDLADLSAELGYYDQAHFTRAFTSAVGMPPGTYARWCRDRLAEPVKALAG